MKSMIYRKTFFPLAAVLLVATLLPATAFGDEKKNVTTTVTVGEMCSGCVKMITKRFSTEQDVAKVKCDIATKSVMIFPAEDTRLSPRRLWEIMESVGKTPKKLVSPEGTFTSKPKKS